MAATLLKEDGSGLEASNTYISLADYETYLDERGLTDSSPDDAKTGRIIQSMDYIESRDSRFQGYKKHSNQALVWPRTSVVVNQPHYLDSTTIPSQLKNAQAQLVYDSLTNAIYKVGDGLQIVRKKIDVLEKEYANQGVSNPQNSFEKVENFLRPLYSRGGSGGLGVIRG